MSIATPSYLFTHVMVWSSLVGIYVTYTRVAYGDPGVIAPTPFDAVDKALVTRLALTHALNPRQFCLTCLVRPFSIRTPTLHCQKPLMRHGCLMIVKETIALQALPV